MQSLETFSQILTPFDLSSSCTASERNLYAVVSAVFCYYSLGVPKCPESRVRATPLCLSLLQPQCWPGSSPKTNALFLLQDSS